MLIFVSFSGCKKTVSDGDLVVVQMSQNRWSLDYVNSFGTISVVLEGAGIQNIVIDSIRMTGDNPSAEPLNPVSAYFEGEHVVALFAKNRVMVLLMNPAAGSNHRVQITFYKADSSDPVEVDTVVTVTDDPDENDNSAFSLEIDPAEWDLNFVNSAGTVEAFIRGEGFDNIDLDSIQMQGDNPEALPIEADSVASNNNHIHARFPKNQVIDLLLDPANGTSHTIIVSFLVEGGTERTELEAVITVIGDDEIIDPSELELEIAPEEWNLNFTNSSGTVEAFIEGEGFDEIDLNSLQMLGDNPGAEPLAADSASLKGDHIHARFPKNQVIGLLLNPTEGSTHTITVSFLEQGGTERIELSAQITIEDDDDEEEPIDTSALTLEIVPPQWNMNYAGSTGQVKAFIRGSGLENIDLDSIEMEGDNGAATPLPADSATLNGDHIQAKFPKNQVLDLLSNPAAGTTHTVTVTFMSGGQRQELSTEISITN